MAITYQWHTSDQTIMHVEFPAQWSWEDFETAYRATQDEIRVLPHNVGVVWDCCKVSKLPLNAMSKVAAFGKQVTPAPNVYGFVVVTTNQFLLSLIRVMNSMLKLDKSKQPVSAVATLDEAIAFLKKVGKDSSRQGITSGQSETN